MISLDTLFPHDMMRSLSEKVKQRRLELNLTQEGLARKADVKLPTYRKFERTGEISLKGLLQIAFALNMLSDFEALFNRRQYQSIEEVLADKPLTRKRGKNK